MKVRKDTPTTIKTYYKMFIEDCKSEIENLYKEIEEAETQFKVTHGELLQDIQSYKDSFNVDLMKYSEFVNNEYTTGDFYKVAKGIYLNKKDDYKLTAESFILYNFANAQKLIYDKKKRIEFLKKCTSLTLFEYQKILHVYWHEVHRKMILEGCGYAFGKGIGWICINRVTIKKHKPLLDYVATKKRKEELLAEGKRLFNKEEADWCLRNGLEYDGVDYRVFRKLDYCYEIPLIHCTLPNGSKLKLEMSDYRGKPIRGKTNDMLIEECNGDTNKICDLFLGLKTKLTLCDKVDKILYTKFIRNENQQSINTPKSCRKD